VVGREAARAYQGFDLGSTVRFGGGLWTVVGTFEAGGSAFESEVWCDADALNAVYQRPRGIFQSVTARLASPEDLSRFREGLLADRRMTVQVDGEVDYYVNQSRGLTSVIVVLGTLVAAVMGLGAVFGALNTLYSSVAERGREIGVLRAIGYGAGSVASSFLLEALLIALAGGVVGALAALPLNGLTTGTMNWQTFSRVAFAFRIGPEQLAWGMAFALVMGVLGGLPPALRAARRPVAGAVRAL